ncbi:hypothetical protein [Rhodococcus sp. 2G]|uniref:hypothetical protein n=1 Tax=Rhodococcus sp. 2G TaxID=1570939 RepID=UPI000A555DE6|nr:hypothetical protein [Rhodococcus sp. 2G]
MAMMSPVARTAAALHPFVVRHAPTIDRWTVRGLTLLVSAAALLSIGGLRGLVALSAVGLGSVALWYGARRFPQVTGAALSTAVWTALVGAVAVAVGPVFAMAHADVVLLYPVGLLMVLAATYVMRSPGVHRGWTTAVGHAVVMASFPVALLWPGTAAAGYSYMVSVIAALALVLWRDRKGARTREALTGLSRWIRRGARGIALGVIAVVLLGSISVAIPPEVSANPISWVGGKITGAASGAMSDVVCAITRPDLSGQPPGSGPEQFLSNRNLGKVQNSDGGVPDFAKDAGRFDRAATASNHSMDSYTLYEISGLRGVKWVNWQLNADGEENCAMMPWISTLIGNQLMQINAYLLQSTIALKEYAQAKNPIQGLYQSVSPVVGELYSIFVLMMAVVITIAGIAAAVRAMNNGGVRRGLGDVGMSLLVALVAGVFYGGVTVASWAKPEGNGFYTVAAFGDHVGGMLSSAFADGIFNILNTQTDQDMMCQSPAATNDGQVTDLGHRYTSCVLAETLLYQPWAIGQFGRAGESVIEPDDEATRFRDPTQSQSVISRGDEGEGLPCYNNYNGCSDMRSYLLVHTGGPSIDRARADCLDGDDSFEALSSCDPYYAVAASLHRMADDEQSVGPLTPDDAAATLVAFAGSGTMPHVAKSLSALFGTVIACVGIAAMSLIALWWHVALLVVFILGPLRLTWAALPGKGKMMKNWIDDMVYAIVMASVYSILCTLMVFMLGLVFSSNAAAGFKLLWSVAVLIGMWVAMKKVEAAARPEGATQVNAAGTMQAATMGALGTASVMAAAGYRRNGRDKDGSSPSQPDPLSKTAAPTAPRRTARVAAGAAARKAGDAAAFAARPVVEPAKQRAVGTVAAASAAARNSRIVVGAEELGGRVAAGTARAGGVALDAARGLALRTHGAYISQETRDGWVAASQSRGGMLARSGIRARAGAARAAQQRREHQEAMDHYRESLRNRRSRDDQEASE